MASKSNPKIQFLTDEFIMQFSGSNVLHTPKDTNGHVKNELKTIEGGPLDANIFGSCFSRQCNCGHIRKVSNKPCEICGSRVLTEADSWSRYARIDLPIYFCNDLRTNKLYKFLKNNFSWRYEFSDEFKELIKTRKRLAYEYCQFSYDEAEDKIVVTDNITDIDMCGYEGLLTVILENYPSKVGKYKSYINSSILVMPLPMRAPIYEFNGVKKRLKNSKITIVYISILHIFESDRAGRWIGWYKEAMNSCSTAAEMSMLNALLREFLANAVASISELLLPSKENISRTMQSHRLPNSGRCTIIPAPDLKPDEVYIPRHLMYECCQKEFIQYLMDTNNWTYATAKSWYYDDATAPEVQMEFDNYINSCADGQGKHVIINRNPTLYEYGMFCCKVKLTNNYTIGLPLELCSPTNGDYDGDTFSFYSVPEQLTGLMKRSMSPRNTKYYKKNLGHMYLPSHEILSGIMVGTRVYPSTNPDMPEYHSYEEAYNAKKKDRRFKWQTPFLFVDDANCKTTVTTLARMRFSEYFDFDINEMLGGYDGGKNLTSSDMQELYDRIEDYPDRLERIDAIKDFALLITTTSGNTAPKLSELHAKLDLSYIERIRKIEEFDTWTEKEKDIKIREIYDEFMKDVEKGTYKDEEGVEHKRIPDELKNKIIDSGRAKVSQLLNIMMPQLTVGPDHQVHVGDSTLIEGMNPTDYRKHSIENRGTQDIKVSATPRSGYTTRQLVYLGNEYSLADGTDDTNPGIEIPIERAAGRTRVEDGSIITKAEAKAARKSGKMVTVRSIVTSKNTAKKFITKDCVSQLNDWQPGAHIGVSLLSSLTEGLTQAGLSLKHGGRLFETDPLSEIKAPEKCTLRMNDMVIVLVADSGKEYVYPKPSNFVQNYTAYGYYKKGDRVGVSYRQFTPSYKLDSIIKLIGASATHSKKSMINNKVLVTECYAYEGGKITYNRVGDKITGVTIGARRYNYNPEACYYYPEGTEIKKYQRFCTGTIDMYAAIKNVHDYKELFYLFLGQFDELIPGITPELIEFVYVLILSNNNGKYTLHKVAAAIANGLGTLNKLAFRNAKEILKNIDHHGMNFLFDNISAMLLPTLLMYDKDE